AALALTAGMLTSFGLQGYRLWQQQSTQPEQPAVTPQAVVPQDAKATAADVANANLFGQPQQQEAAPVELQTENLPVTNLRLVLRGVSASTTDELASALVEGPDQQTHAYVVGDLLPVDATLRAVYPNRIVIERRGRLENLYS